MSEYENNAEQTIDVDAVLVDKRSILQVLGCLMVDPTLFDGYKFEDGDFYLPFHRLIYSIIFNLYNTGAEKIDAFAIDSYCSRYPKQYELFNDNHGIDYINGAIELAQINNFKYYYDRLKKFSYLRYLKDECHLDIRPLYDYTVNDFATQERFDKETIEDLIAKVENKMITVPQSKYCSNVQVEEFRAGEGLRKQKEKWKEKPDYGISLQSDIISTIVRGARLGKIFLYSGSSGSGKTRLNYGNMAHISVPYYYDYDAKDFIYTGMDNPTLIIQTELQKEENQSLILAYVSGVNEEHIRSGNYDAGEEARVDKAIEYIESSPLRFVVIHDFSVNEIVNIIRRYKREYGVLYYLFDYIQMSQSLIMETAKMSNGMRLREDQIIFLAVDRLKNLCNELGVFLQSGSQLNGTYKDAAVKDETMLRSAKSMADRVDFAEIGLPPTESELKAVSSYIPRTVGMHTPNLVRSIYKCRATKWTKIKVWQYADLGTCRTEDLFVTNNNNVLINIPVVQIVSDGQVIDSEGRVVGKSFDAQIESVLNENSVDINKVDPEEIYDTMNPTAREEAVNNFDEDIDKMSELQRMMAEQGW